MVYTDVLIIWWVHLVGIMQLWNKLMFFVGVVGALLAVSVHLTR